MKMIIICFFSILFPACHGSRNGKATSIHSSNQIDLSEDSIDNLIMPTYVDLDSAMFHRNPHSEYLKLAQFPGGEDSLQQFISNNINVPLGLKLNNYSVYVRVDIDALGQITNLHKFTISEDCLGCEIAVKEVINKLPRFLPGYYVNGNNEFLYNTSSSRYIEVRIQ